MEWLLGLGVGGGYGLFSYNRRNFMFDGKMQLEREYQGQTMQIARFQQYREDIRDLIDLTVSKMDHYLVISTIQLSMAVVLFTEGKPHTESWPERTIWLYSLCNVGAIMYFALSMWLAMHASIAAHSHGVRMLTQFVRLPVPNRAQLDAARAQALDYEAKGAGNFFRIPVWKQQAGKFSSNWDKGTSPDNLASMWQASTDIGSLGPAEQKHIQIYREIQKNWIAYDAYARVCMLMGANQFVYAVAYYMIGIYIIENRSPFIGLVGAVVFCVATWLILKLDMYIPHIALITAGTLFLIAPVAEIISITISITSDLQRGWLIFAHVMMPIVFLMHIIWILFIVAVAQAEYKDGVALPMNFRSVTYLDVFGWLQASAEVSENRAASARPTEPSIISLPPVEEGPEGDEVELRDNYSTNREITSSSDAMLPQRLSMPSCEDAPQLSIEMRLSLLGDCRRVMVELQQDIERWENPAVKEMFDERTDAQVCDLRRSFDTAVQALRTAAGHSTGTDTSIPVHQRLQCTDATVWVRLNLSDPIGQNAGFYYCVEEDKSQWTKPEAPDRISDIRSLQDQLFIFVKTVNSLQDCIAQTTIAEGDAASHGRTDSNCETTSALEFGGGEAVRLSEQSQLADMFFTSGAHVASSFCPQPEHTESLLVTDSSARALRPPGHVPFRTFCQGSAILVSIWCLGLVWNILGLVGIVIPIVSEKKQNGTDISGPEIVFSGEWPHPFFAPTGLACHPAAGHIALVAERYAVHEIDWQPWVTEDMNRHGLARSSSRSVLSECLSDHPEFHAGGIGDISMQCGFFTVDRNTSCTVLLLSAGGHQVLQCPLREGTGGSATFRLPRLHSWHSLVAGIGQRTYWGLAPNGLVELSKKGQLKEGPEDLVPLSRIDDTLANTTRLHVVANGAGGALIAMNASGYMRSLRFEGGEPADWQLQKQPTRKWLGLCSTSDGLLVASKAHDTQAPSLWLQRGVVF